MVINRQKCELKASAGVVLHLDSIQFLKTKSMNHDYVKRFPMGMGD